MNKVYTAKEMDAIQQPLDNKSGYSNPRFDKLYGHKAKNPFHGTERDILNKKNYHFEENVEECEECGKRAEFIGKENGEIKYRLCRECYHK